MSPFYFLSMLGTGVLVLMFTLFMPMLLVTSFPPSPSKRTILQRRQNPQTLLHNDQMKRPLLDTIASFLFQLETNRVKASSQVDDKGRLGEPMEWSQDSSLANRWSLVMAEKGYGFKQWVADIIAGDYNQEETLDLIQTFIQQQQHDSSEPASPVPVPIVMFSFTTCPFCRRAKDLLDGARIPYRVLELDELKDNKGNEIRSMLGKMTKRTSVPSIFIHGKAIGGLNDGMPGLQALYDAGELDPFMVLGSGTSDS
jgi:glutaredoxin 3